LPTGADLAAAFSIPVSLKPAAGVLWAIGDGPHKNMQAGKKGFFISHKYPHMLKMGFCVYLLILRLGRLASIRAVLRYSAISMAIIIIPNSAGMFNKNITFFKNIHKSTRA
jgi:hypothetical protein